MRVQAWARSRPPLAMVIVRLREQGQPRGHLTDQMTEVWHLLWTECRLPCTLTHSHLTLARLFHPRFDLERMIQPTVREGWVRRRWEWATDTHQRPLLPQDSLH